MTDAVRSDLSNARPAPSQGERAANISAGMALRKPVGSSVTPSSVVSDKTGKGARARRSESGPYLLAGDLMSSPAITVRTTEPVSSVAQLMLESGVGGVPVLDAGERPVGMVSDGDLLGRRGEGSREWWLEMLAKQSQPVGLVKNALERPVGEIMSAPLIAISTRATVQQITETLQANRIKRLPVLDDEKLVGVVSRTDLLRFVESVA